MNGSTQSSEARAGASVVDARAPDDARQPKYTVRVVAELLGVPTATLRSWNRRYGVGPAGHSPGRHRLYSDNDIAMLEHMHTLIGDGASPSTAARAAAAAVRPQPADIGSLLDAAFALDIVTAARLVDGNLQYCGVVQTWNQLVRPAFREIEVRQAGGDRCIDVEHALSWVVTRSLQRLPTTPSGPAAGAVLACTEWESHTMPLEALRAALAERGQGAVMLGAAVPLDAVRTAARRRPHVSAVVLWSQTARTADVSAVKAVVDLGVQVLLAGPGWDSALVPAAAVRVDSLWCAVRRLIRAA